MTTKKAGVPIDKSDATTSDTADVIPVASFRRHLCPPASVDRLRAPRHSHPRPLYTPMNLQIITQECFRIKCERFSDKKHDKTMS